LLIDYYHLRLEAEDPGIILEAGSAIRHVHFAESTGRVFPLASNPDYDAFFSNLRQIGYSGRCSIEAYSEDFSADAGPALAVLRAAAEGNGTISSRSAVAPQNSARTPAPNAK
jgi:D-psicose/D-tagatose/L-ribulose 3-epimerase